jgi:hypothetical protein
MIVRFCPRKLGVKPDVLTRHWDVYPKEGDKDYARVNPHNFQLVFTQEQLAVSLRAIYLAALFLQASTLFDIENLHNDILATLPSDPLAAIHLSTSESPDSRWSIDTDSFLRLDGRIYVPDSNDLRLRVPRYTHDHLLSGVPTFQTEPHLGPHSTQIHLARTENICKGLHLVLHILHPRKGS